MIKQRRSADKLKNTLLLVDNDKETIDTICLALKKSVNILDIIVVNSITDAEKEIKQKTNIDIIIVDIGMSANQNILDFLINLRKTNSQISMVIYADCELELSKEIELKRLGVQDIVEKSKGPELLSASVENVLANRFLMYYDNMTHTLAKLMFAPAFQKEVDKVNTEEKYSTTMVNIDYKNFSEVNNTMGHETGDDVLIASSEIIRKNLRETDLMFRMGGDEFCVIMPSTNTKTAIQVMQRICNLVKNSPEIKDISGIQISINVGIVELIRGTREKEAMAKSEIAMYKAKREDKDIVFYSNKDKDYIIKG